ncbi:MAG: 3'-5' exoribonuclease [Candidatus Sumerlaeota bacterium]|nr:3'-5' exoribonuclease [Candidatus Sumerlaeota bacterium]
MSYIMVDVEADGPIPADYSMISLGAVVVEPRLMKTFYGELHPISEEWLPEALSISGFSREETLGFGDPKEVMTAFREWLRKYSKGRPIFVSDNEGFDWQFVNYYFHHFLGANPFGHSATNLSSMYRGLTRDASRYFSHLRVTKHTHNPLDDARGNAEAMLAMKDQYAMQIKIQ